MEPRTPHERSRETCYELNSWRGEILFSFLVFVSRSEVEIIVRGANRE